MLSVVILNYNTRDITAKCLTALYASKNVEFETILIDNASTDDSVPYIAKHFPKVKLVKNKTNVGFAAGNNQGMKLAKGDHILLLNSDCFVGPDTLSLAINQADVVGCKLLNADGSIQPSYGYFPTLDRVAMLMTFLDNMPFIRTFYSSIHVRDIARYENRQQVDWVTGAFVLLKKEVFTSVGGIDEKYFMYGEEMEWMYRMKQAGFTTIYLPSASATHLGRASSKSNTLAFLSEMKGYLYWYQKHNSSLARFLLSVLLIAGCAIRVPAWAIWGKFDLAKSYWEVLPQIIAASFAPTK